MAWRQEEYDKDDRTEKMVGGERPEVDRWCRDHVTEERYPAVSSCAEYSYYMYFKVIFMSIKGNTLAPF